MSPASGRSYPVRSLWVLDVPTYEAGPATCPACAAGPARRTGLHGRPRRVPTRARGAARQPPARAPHRAPPGSRPRWRCPRTRARRCPRLHQELVRLGGQAVVDDRLDRLELAVGIEQWLQPGVGLLELVRLDVHEVDPVRVVRRDALDDVQGRTAGRGGAEGGRREHDPGGLARTRPPGRCSLVEGRVRASGPWRSPRSPRGSSRSGSRTPGPALPMAGVVPNGSTSNTHARAQRASRQRRLQLQAPRARAVEGHRSVVQPLAVARVDERAGHRDHRRRRVTREGVEADLRGDDAAAGRHARVSPGPRSSTGTGWVRRPRCGC